MVSSVLFEHCRAEAVSRQLSTAALSESIGDGNCRPPVQYSRRRRGVQSSPAPTDRLGFAVSTPAVSPLMVTGLGWQ
jgi:hypothetical protein